MKKRPSKNTFKNNAKNTSTTNSKKTSTKTYITRSNSNLKKKRKKTYIPGLAQLKFIVEPDWSVNEAKELYKNYKEIGRLPNEKLDRIEYLDCLQGMKQIPDNSIDLIIADPPFGIKFDGKGAQYNRKPEKVINGYNEIPEKYDKFTFAWISDLYRILKEHGSAYILSGWSNLHDILNAINNTPLKLINHIIWKYQFGVFTKKKFVSSHYHILFVVKNQQKYFFNKYEYYPLDVWEIPRTYRPNEEKNGTKLPESLVIRMIQFSSKPGDLIFDPFMGNGTTAICAKGLYRHYYGFEINRELKMLHDRNINKIKIGEFYKPLNEFRPSTEELLKKYPHLKKYVE